VSILAFFTKPYFAFGLPIVAAYLFLFRSKSAGLSYGAISLAALAVLIAVVTFRYECYFANVVTGNRAAAGARVPLHLLHQLTAYALSLPGTIAVLLVMSPWRRISPTIKLPGQGWRSPLLDREVDFFVFTLGSCVLAFCIQLGLHGGNSMLYAYQFISPWLVIVVFSYIGQASRKPATIATALVALDLGLFLLMRPPVPSSHLDVWNQWRAMIQPCSNVYAPPPLAWISV